ncbi:serine protease HTRA2, mitochondrial-like [Oppia nitens]|uniref:serine protease HTRA2, mitochondrial-like n=1 Tax=Oppia nitens TaxID=1686743 RepID=UPI0023DA8F88|nr:serine protease HTRA2, mitochondrial-like [Oppia nitens]XP_054156940.1 serine protease HTRA2, mitochondrial-like [Oppia nitens]
MARLIQCFWSLRLFSNRTSVDTLRTTRQTFHNKCPQVVQPFQHRFIHPRSLMFKDYVIIIVSIFGSNYLIRQYFSKSKNSFGDNIGDNYVPSDQSLSQSSQWIQNFIQKFVPLRTVQLFIKNDNKIDDKSLPLSKRFNFIADVTETVSSALVFIEVQGRHPFFSELNVSISSGSGFLVHPSGQILTNAHVVANASTVSVKLPDGRLMSGRVEYVDHRLDLATIRLDSRDEFPYIVLGDSNKSRTGEWVIAMGSPFSLSNTITVGVISSLKRKSHELGLNSNEIDYIQTDAPINIGNSGGPLVNLDGQAIGINTMKVTAGISFAIPSDYAKEFIERANRFTRKTQTAKNEEKLSKRNRFIGLTMLSLTPTLIEELRTREPDFPDVSTGILVWKVVMGSPAHLGGIQPGDIITRINGLTAKSVEDIYKALEVDQSLSLTVRRRDRHINLVIKPQIIV